MIVLDASAWADYAIGIASPSVTAAMTQDAHWAVPEHFRVEALSALRGTALGAGLSWQKFAELSAELAELDFDQWPTAPLVPRIVELARNATAYDAAYVALAEELGCPLVTADAKLARIPGIRCHVVGAE